MIKNGYDILETNFRTFRGEIDIIACYRNCIHFIEVKTRKHFDEIRPCESVNATKQKHIKEVSKSFLVNYKGKYSFISFDVIEIEINYLENVF